MNKSRLRKLSQALRTSLRLIPRNFVIFSTIRGNSNLKRNPITNILSVCLKNYLWKKAMNLISFMIGSSKSKIWSKDLQPVQDTLNDSKKKKNKNNPSLKEITIPNKINIEKLQHLSHKYWIKLFKLILIHLTLIQLQLLTIFLPCKEEEKVYLCNKRILMIQLFWPLAMPVGGSIVMNITTLSSKYHRTIQEINFSYNRGNNKMKYNRKVDFKGKNSSNHS